MWSLKWCFLLFLGSEIAAKTLQPDDLLVKSQGEQRVDPQGCTPTCPPKSASCTKDPSLFNSDGSLISPVTYGRWINACSVTYLINTTLVSTFDEAEKICCSLGMQLLEIKNRQQEKCLNNEIDSYMYEPQYWTSGRSGPSCPEKFRWCDSDVEVPTDASWWAKGEPNHYYYMGLEELCLSYRFRAPSDNQNNQDVDVASLFLQKTKEFEGLNDLYCQRPTSFICQSSTMKMPVASNPCKPTCPPQSYTKNDKLFNSDGELTNPSQYGDWKDSCSMTYLISKNEATSDEAAELCYSLGMKLIEINDRKKKDCLKENMRDISGERWTHGRGDPSCDKEYRWCGSDTMFEVSKVRWDDGQPINYEQCVTAQFNPYYDISLRDSACDQPRKYICEGPTTVRPKTLNPTTCVPTLCPKSTCVRNEKLFNEGGILKSAGKFGTLKKVCSKTYMIGNTEKTYEEAQQACCSLGMTLIELNDAYETRCLDKVLPSGYHMGYWTNGRMDLKCGDNFRWCSNNTIPSKDDVTWNEYTGSEDGECIYNNFEEETYERGLGKKPCDTPMSYICESEVLQDTATAVQKCDDTCPQGTCTKNMNLFKENQILKKRSSYGNWLQLCSKTYLISKEKKTFDEAEKLCCSLGMKLVEVKDENNKLCLKQVESIVNKPSPVNFDDSEDEDYLLNRLINEDNPEDGEKETDFAVSRYEIKEVKRNSFWTYGRSHKTCDSTHRWCGSDSVLDPKDISKSYKKDNVDSCLTYKMSKLHSWDPETTDSGKNLIEITCNEKINFLCEGPTTEAPSTEKCTPTCPPKLKDCNKDANLFDSDGTLKDPKSVGKWRNICGKTYLVSNKTAAREEIEQYCCSIGMKMLELETNAEQTCLSNALIMDGEDKNGFWTSGSADPECSLHYKWCTSDTEIRNELAWEEKEPSGDEDCISVALTPTTGSQLKLLASDNPCRLPFQAICEGPATPAPKTKCVATCPPSPTCKKDRKQLLNNEGVLNDETPIGKFVEIKVGLSYQDVKPVLVGLNETKTYEEAAKTCCSVGMRLLEVKSKYMLESLQSQLRGLRVTGSNKQQFWLGGRSDSSCPGQARWCQSNTPIGDIFEEPQGGSQCVAMNFPVFQNNFFDFNSYQRYNQYYYQNYLINGYKIDFSDCDSKIYYICEEYETLAKSPQKYGNIEETVKNALKKLAMNGDDEDVSETPVAKTEHKGKLKSKKLAKKVAEHIKG